MPWRERLHQRFVDPFTFMLFPSSSADNFYSVYCVEYPTGRILRDARLYAVGAGTQEIRRMLIGREFNEQFKQQY